MPDISRTAKVTITLSAFDMGQEFANMHSDEQAQFFNGVASAIKDYPKPACFQWQAMRDGMEGLPDALQAFKDMAEYGPDFQPMQRTTP